MGGGQLPACNREPRVAPPAANAISAALFATLPAPATGLARQPSLQFLLLSHNGFSGALPQAWETPQLLRLDVQRNELAGPLPAALGSLPSLVVLQAGSNQLTGTLEPFAQVRC